ncbi:MAG: lipoprotein-releasing ABC transporter ATP-binding protein LolD [Pseudohongiellaceae bacterium]
MNDRETVLACIKLCKCYSDGPEPVEVLSGLDLTVKAQEQVAIVGSSGSGKTTLLNLLGGLDTATEGQVLVAGQNIANLNEVDRGKLRNSYLGFVYQFHHLLREFTALENVSMPLLIGGEKKANALEKASEMLSKVGLSHRLSHKPAELSGGERQRVAIARALVTEPRCVLLDEPTGNLDRHTALDIQQLMRDLNQQLGISFVIVTHDEALADSLDRRLTLKDGQLVD